MRKGEGWGLGILLTVIFINLAWWGFVIWAIVSIVHAMQN